MKAKAASPGGMLAGQVAKRLGIGPQTLHYYERERLISTPQRTAAGYRVYTPELVDQLAFIRKAQALGLPLSRRQRRASARPAGVEPVRTCPGGADKEARGSRSANLRAPAIPRGPRDARRTRSRTDRERNGHSLHDRRERSATCRPNAIPVEAEIGSRFVDSDRVTIERSFTVL